MGIDVGNGGTITFGTTGFTGHIEDIDWGGMDRKKVPTTYLGTTTAHTSIPAKLYDPGTLKLKIQFDPNLADAAAALLNHAAETITVTYPNTATAVGSGYVTKYKPGGMKSDELMESEMEITWTGAITFTDGTT